MSQDILKRNNVKASGRGTRPMLFAHGFGCDQNMWRFVAPAFEEDYRVVLFDYVGSGKSDLRAYDPKRYSSLQGYAQDVLDVCAALKAVAERRARVVILDLTGARSLGADVVQHLTRAAAAVRLMGAACVLTGIGAGFARTLVTVGADLSGVEVRRTLADGLRFVCESPANK